MSTSLSCASSSPRYVARPVFARVVDRGAPTTFVIAAHVYSAQIIGHLPIVGNPLQCAYQHMHDSARADG